MNTKINKPLICAAIIFGYALSFVFQGPIFYELLNIKSISLGYLNQIYLLFFVSGLIVMSVINHKKFHIKLSFNIMYGIILILALAIAFVSNSTYFMILLFAISFFIGLLLPNYLYQIIKDLSVKEIIVYMGSFLILANIILTISHFIANNIHGYISYVFAYAVLCIGFLINLKTDVIYIENKTAESLKLNNFLPLLIFAIVYSINSGIIYSTIYPSFFEYKFIVSIYTNIPYIIMIFLLANVIKLNKSTYIMIGVLLWCITFLLFPYISISWLGCIILYTLMVVGSGIFDLFFFATLSENSRLFKKEISFISTLIAVNFFFVFVGAKIAEGIMMITNDKSMISIIGLVICVITSLVFVNINLKLNKILINDDFLLSKSIADSNNASMEKSLEQLLTLREKEVFDLLKLGYTDKQICDELFISASTVKSHNKKIYKKLGINGRKEIMDYIEKQNYIG